MSRNFFTIIKSYFRCCCCDKDKKSESDDEASGDKYPQNCGDRSPFSFDDLTSSANDSGTSSNWSSSSTLDGYDEKQKPFLKESAQRIKKYQRKLFHPYEEDSQ
jgi:hypothetical protein